MSYMICITDIKIIWYHIFHPTSFHTLCVLIVIAFTGIKTQTESLLQKYILTWCVLLSTWSQHIIIFYMQFVFRIFCVKNRKTFNMKVIRGYWEIFSNQLWMFKKNIECVFLCKWRLCCICTWQLHWKYINTYIYRFVMNHYHSYIPTNS